LLRLALRRFWQSLDPDDDSRAMDLRILAILTPKRQQLLEQEKRAAFATPAIEGGGTAND
jgi:hypothetical protein